MRENSRTSIEHDGVTYLIVYVQVLLLHGDSHNYRADQPFAASDWLQPLNSNISALDNFMRIMAPGSPTVNWLQVCVNPDAPALFSQRVVTVEANHNQDYW